MDIRIFLFERGFICDASKRKCDECACVPVYVHIRLMGIWSDCSSVFHSSPTLYIKIAVVKAQHCRYGYCTKRSQKIREIGSLFSLIQGMLLTATFGLVDSERKDRDRSPKA